MKKVILSLVIIYTANVFGQYTVKDLVKVKEVVWFGINFSEARMVGEFAQAFGAGDADASSIKNRWIPSWNSLVVNEPKNFKIAQAFQKEDVYFELSANEALNTKINTEKLMTLNPYHFESPEKTASSIVSKLNGVDKMEGIGVVFIVESFSKMKEQASIYVTLFDIKTKQVLVSEKIVSKPVGIGLRNFWAGSIKSTIKQIDNGYYSAWKNN